MLLHRGCRREAALPHVRRAEFSNVATVVEVRLRGTLPLGLVLLLCQCVNQPAPSQQPPSSQQRVTAPLPTFAYTSASACVPGLRSGPAFRLADVNERPDPQRSIRLNSTDFLCGGQNPPVAKNTYFGRTSASFHSLIGFPPPSVTSCKIKINECRHALTELLMQR